jgi:hypothetical protein
LHLVWDHYIIIVMSVFTPAVSFVFQHVLAFFFVFLGSFAKRACICFNCVFIFVVLRLHCSPTIAFKRLCVCVCVCVVMISGMQWVENLYDEHVGTQSERNFAFSSKPCKRFGILLLLTFLFPAQAK